MKKNNGLFKAYKRRMTISAAIASACYGLIFGSIAAFVTALFCWMFNFNHVWVAIVVWVGCAAISATAVYFLKMRPTDMQVASRIDSMGLEERTITMMDLEGADSPIATLQRKDAVNRINNVSSGQVKSAFPIYSLGIAASVALGITFCAGLAMTLVQGLTGAGVIAPPGIIDSERENWLTVSYIANEGGIITGEGGEEQIVLRGEDTQPVEAEAEDGWMFVQWSDGNKNPIRSEKEVTDDLIIEAVFKEIDDTGEAGEGGDGSTPDSDGDYDQSAPNPDQDSGGDGNGSGEGGDGNGSGDKGEGNGGGSGGQDGEGQGQGQGDGAGGGWSDSNNIIDGETPYRDVIDAFLDEAASELESGKFPPELIEFIEGYFGSI